MSFSLYCYTIQRLLDINAVAWRALGEKEGEEGKEKRREIRGGERRGKERRRERGGERRRGRGEEREGRGGRKTMI